MDADRRKPAGKSFLDIVVGLEAGVLGGLAMLAWFATIMPLFGLPWYLMPNSVGVRFYADRYALLSPGIVTFSGAAWVIIAAGIVGTINGLLSPGGRLFGLLMAAIWYLISYFLLWKRFAPFLFAYAPQHIVIAGFVVYGSVIGWHPRLLAHTRARIPH